ncbi:hypothetical protein SERLADRAFT_455922 [Serpula lacrymans var. lacrymans S7.9]|uniref:Uncharacterized protein n=1 Tax=Serpula lacrymans var. lacrymans (strain S7.9) TaxID=578457 RepID=F8NF53_SERL9|nr:uncharacterized protein SERLADRAFT_455922 [Serpula lacrymans var. lacrymans S7.9]EGO31173.1 hypothetical protein SERLADRAFT_455922 [Serpula lacrymans var. lacrymans S7.9]
MPRWCLRQWSHSNDLRKLYCLRGRVCRAIFHLMHASRLRWLTMSRLIFASHSDPHIQVDTFSFSTGIMWDEDFVCACKV